MCLCIRHDQKKEQFFWDFSSEIGAYPLSKRKFGLGAVAGSKVWIWTKFKHRRTIAALISPRLSRNSSEWNGLSETKTISTWLAWPRSEIGDRAPTSDARGPLRWWRRLGHQDLLWEAILEASKPRWWVTRIWVRIVGVILHFWSRQLGFWFVEFLGFCWSKLWQPWARQLQALFFR